MKEINRILEIIKIIFVESGIIIFEGVKREIPTVLMLLKIVFPVLMVMIYNDRRYNLSHMDIFLISISFYIVVRFIEKFIRILKKETVSGIPIRDKRYTYINEFDCIEVNNRDISEAIQYLYDVEEYIYRSGYKNLKNFKINVDKQNEWCYNIFKVKEKDSSFNDSHKNVSQLNRKYHGAIW